MIPPRLLLLIPPLALAVPPVFAAPQGVLHLRLCSGATVPVPIERRDGGGGDPSPCPAACHALPCDRRHPGKRPRLRS